ncbi:hypothetical protein BZA70DRAFT_102107 [Myxozyma melibiosi]|uniref:Acyl-CoA dehydrogenase n=1 Tax=Myxozyma melibiosi TaxID=54550 RepID=A0ABR1EY07_9ASCO
MAAASASSGFIQSTPQLRNQFTSDPSLQRIFTNRLPKEVSEDVLSDLHDFGQYVVSDEIFDYVQDAESNPPTVETYDAFGNRVNRLRTSYGWKKEKDLAASHGIIAAAYERKYGQDSRVYQFLKYYLYAPSSALFTCPLAMTDGCARVLEIYGVRRDVFDHLTSRDPSNFWTSGQWMTERSGGSDVSGTETYATKLPGTENKYEVSGFKWFSSATDSQVALLLAREHEKGKLSCFLGDIKSGGANIVRLKNKLGTKPLPTAELELRNLKAELIGDRERGVAVISAVLNITRIHNSVNAAAFLRRSLEIVKEFSLVRKVFGQPLHTVASHVHTLADLEVRQNALMQITFRCVALLGKSECGSASADELFLMRCLPSLVKAYTGKRALAGVSECMEAMGGVGYLENEPALNIARLERDAQVLTIWEGTTNVLCDDFVSVVHAKAQHSVSAFRRFLEKTLQNSDRSLSEQILGSFEVWAKYIQGSTLASLRSRGRAVGFYFADIVSAALLSEDAAFDNDPRAVEIARRYAARLSGSDPLAKFSENSASDYNTAAVFHNDYLIVFGKPPEKDPRSKL